MIEKANERIVAMNAFLGMSSKVPYPLFWSFNRLERTMLGLAGDIINPIIRETYQFRSVNVLSNTKIVKLSTSTGIIEYLSR